MRTDSDFICKEHSLSFDPTLALIFGTNETFILCQIQYWVKIKTADTSNKYADSFRDDRVWVYNSYTDWQVQFPFMGRTTLKKAIYSLQDIGVLITANYNKRGYDKTKWYAIDYDRLDEIVNRWYVKNGHTYDNIGHTTVKFRQGAMSDSDRPIPYTTSDISPEISSEISYNNLYGSKPEKMASNSVSEDDFDFGVVKKQVLKACNELNRYYDNINETKVLDIVEYYYTEYYRRFHKNHPRIKQPNMLKVVEKLLSGTDLVEVNGDFKAYKVMINKHFQTQYNNYNCNYSIVHFMTDGIIDNRYHEVVENRDLDEEDEDCLPFE